MRTKPRARSVAQKSSSPRCGRGTPRRLTGCAYARAVTLSAIQRSTRRAHVFGPGRRAVQELLTDTEEGQRSALRAALGSPTSLISDFQNYRVVIANPVNAFIGAVNSGGILVTDGKNSISFDPLFGILKTDGEVHARGAFYWDLGARDDQDGVFIVPRDAP